MQPSAVRPPWRHKRRLHCTADNLPAPVQETPKVVPEGATSVEPTQEPMVVLPLRPILQSLPPMQLAGTSSRCQPMRRFRSRLRDRAAARERQSRDPAQGLSRALPEQYRGLFLPDAVEAPVQLSLPDVLANLPGDSLRMRDDQEVFAQDEIFETPFPAKAKEDAERFAPEPGSDSAPQPVSRRAEG